MDGLHSTSLSLDRNDRATAETAEPKPRSDSFPREEVLQQWEGRVTEIREGEFSARLVDLTALETEEREQADFLIIDLSEADRRMLRDNALFRWLIGYRYIGSTKERFMRIVFRRLPAWTETELKLARKAAEQLESRMVWD